MVDGGIGADYVDGGSGNDFVAGDEDLSADWAVWSKTDKLANAEGGYIDPADRDVVVGGWGDDVLLGQRGSDCLYAGGGNDQVYGGSGADYLQGDTGNDIMAGGTGNDWMAGGCGADTFVFSVGSGKDVILDFSVRGGDVLDFSLFGLGAPVGGAVAPAGVTIANVCWGTLVSVGDDSVLLAGVRACELTSADFLWV
jgi:Ca2+-binding RTX toxin-like protein